MKWLKMRRFGTGKADKLDKGLTLLTKKNYGSDTVSPSETVP